VPLILSISAGTVPGILSGAVFDGFELSRKELSSRHPETILHEPAESQSAASHQQTTIDH
jgi:hypothetical protein